MCNQTCVNKHAPMKRLTPREIKIIAKLIKLRNKAHARKKRQPNNVNCKRFYNLLMNRVHRELKKSKKQYYADYFADNVNNIEKTWEGIRKIANVKKMSMKTTQLNIVGRAIDDEAVLAKNFNNFFFLQMLVLILKTQYLKFLIYHL